MFPWEDQRQFSIGGRTFIVPVDEPELRGGGAQAFAAATFELRQRDSLDFAVDFSTWLAANGSNAQIDDAEWSVAEKSPKTPVILGNGFSPAGRCVVVVKAAEGAVVGDGYWLDVKVTVGATTATSPEEVALPARTLVRRIAVIVVAG